ncbi:MAG: O-antigen ligase family protein [Candidatus Omnitrophica bacterium]|nr:O-antigen ligase family protein [Candidatus Omnitrophota bacterium]
MKILELVMDKKRLILYCDRVIFVSLCLLIFWLPISKAVVESFTLSAFVFWVLKRVFGYRAESLWRMLPKTGLNIALGICILITALSVIFSVDFRLSLRAFFGKELKFLAIYFMLVEVVNSSQRLKYILTAIIASAMLVTADAVMQYSRGVDFLMRYKWDRLTASFSTANGFAGWLIVIIPLFLGLLLAGKAVNRGLKALLMVLIALLSVCLLATYARGAWLGFIMAIVLMIGYAAKSFSLKVRLLCLFTGVGLIAIFLFLPQPIKSKVTAIGRLNFRSYETINLRVKSVLTIEEGGSTLFRFKLWKEALRIIRDYNFTGCGLNTYSIVARDYKSFDRGGIYPHNSYLQKAAETGLFGLAAFFGILFIFFKIGLRYFNQKKDYLALGLLSGILAFLVHAFFDTHLYSLQLVVLFWYMLGLTIAVIKLETDSYQNSGG